MKMIFWDDEALYVYIDFHGKGRIDVIGEDPNFVAEAKWEEQRAADAETAKTAELAQAAAAAPQRAHALLVRGRPEVLRVERLLGSSF